MEGGIYVTFFEPGEPFERELPPVGPLDHVVVRPGRLVADRRAGHAHDAEHDVVKALHAEIELQRALGVEPGEPKRSEMRLHAPDGVFLRLISFDRPGANEGPELGPFAVVVVGKAGLEADGQLILRRQGETMPDVALRTSTTAYHARVMPAAPPVLDTVAAPAERSTPELVPVRDTPAPLPPPTPIPAAPVIDDPRDTAQGEPSFFRPTVRRPIEIYSPPGSHGAISEAVERREPSAPMTRLDGPLPPSRSGPTLRSRMADQQQPAEPAPAVGVESPTWKRYRAEGPTDRILIGANEPPPSHFDARTLLWRWRIAIIGVLVVAVATYAISTVLLGGAGDRPQVVGVGQRFSSAHWDYVVADAQRAPSAGRVNARGVLYVVRVTATNRGAESARLLPSDFTLIDANGVQYAAESLASEAYAGSDKGQTPFVWPDAFPVGRATAVPVVFDVPATLPRGMRLKVSDLPNTKVTLD